MAANDAVVLMKGYLGDAVMTTPLLFGLVEKGFRVHAITEAPVIQLLASSFPSVNFYQLRELREPSQLFRQVEDMRALSAHTILITNRSFRSALAARLARIPVRVGHRSDLRSFLLTKAVRYDKLKNEALCYLDLARAIGIEIECETPRLAVAEAVQLAALPRLQGATVGFQPGARHIYKQIPLPVLASVARTLQQEGHKIALFGGPDEKGAGEAFLELLDQQAMNLVGAFSLSETPAVLSNLRLMVGSDTGLMHIAAASGCPTVTCFGPTRASKWGHLEPPHQVISAPDELITSIKPEEIMHAVRQIL